jgi:hypothetical protein
MSHSKLLTRRTPSTCASPVPADVGFQPSDVPQYSHDFLRVT